ncbi:MAG: 4-hydroxyphenylacetate 3-hydroxylase N-terminal domain-containing protein [Pseudomonadota bacterium]|nr:4-hydroxyphenylacetate 3-hydroxylase N-terminal domain-containing protein [Pseudomonadota bacterium]
MLTGKQYLDSIRDGRKVYIGKELVEDVTSHPAFAKGADTIATIYDRKVASENREVMVSKEGDEEFSTYFLQPKSREDLERRYETHRRIAAWTQGFMGRSPDNFPSYLSGLATQPKLFNELRDGTGDALRAYYEKARREDLFMSHAVTNPQGSRRAGSEIEAAGTVSPTLRVVSEDDEGVTINGLKMIGTGSVYCHETWVGNLQPVPPGQEEETITCAVPLNFDGVSIWSRKPYELSSNREFDAPLSARYDETDAAILFENVKVPWERVFLHNNVAMTREIYFRTPGHSLANHQANIRFVEKLRLIVGIAHKLTESNKAGSIPAVQSTLGKLAAQLANLEGMVRGQIFDYEKMPGGYVTINRRFMYAALHWCSNNHSKICDIVRELMGGGPIQMPADSSVMDNPEIYKKFETYWSLPDQNAKERMKLIRLAWDVLGTEFAGRHMLYEKFYAGPGFVMDLYSYQHAGWDGLDKVVDDLMAGYDHSK